MTELSVIMGSWRLYQEHFPDSGNNDYDLPDLCVLNVQEGRVTPKPGSLSSS
jgi:hypothetical protein